MSRLRRYSDAINTPTASNVSKTLQRLISVAPLRLQVSQKLDGTCQFLGHLRSWLSRCIDGVHFPSVLEYFNEPRSRVVRWAKGFQLYHKSLMMAFLLPIHLPISAFCAVAQMYDASEHYIRAQFTRFIAITQLLTHPRRSKISTWLL